MKQYLLLIFLTLLILSGCKSKSSFLLTFDEFTMRFYDNYKQYIPTASETSIEGMKVLREMKEQTTKEDTGFINSLVVIRTPIQSWTDIKQLADSNTKQLQLKLLKYKNITSANKKMKCDDVQYSWYTITFSYQLDKEMIYGGQYFLADDEALYMVSLSSDNEKDIKNFVKSIETVKCTK